ncbi:MAG TPA: hypothetical protein VJ724_10070, partial [Tahibacter sp.]|nr:hypothetical protein [Tahibacter sp.]
MPTPPAGFRRSNAPRTVILSGTRPVAHAEAIIARLPPACERFSMSVYAVLFAAAFVFIAFKA